MPAPLPHHYRSQITWSGESSAALEAPPRQKFTGWFPPEFDGNDQHWSPEHLFVSSVSLCLLLTFISVAKKSRLEIKGYKCESTCTVDRGEGGLQITAIHAHIDVTVGHADEVERVRPLLDTAKKHCIISNSIKAPVTLAATVTAVALD